MPSRASTPPTRRGRPSAEESRRKLEAVLAVATRQFARQGYRGVTMRAVAQEAQVSTRTLYDRYADKLALFKACLASGSVDHGARELDPAAPPREALFRFAASIVEHLSRAESAGLGMLVYREGPEFPELLAAADANQDAWLVQPLARYLRLHGLERERGCEHAKLFIALAISEYQRRIAFAKPLPGPAERRRHAKLATALFLDGAARSLETP